MTCPPSSFFLRENRVRTVECLIDRADHVLLSHLLQKTGPLEGDHGLNVDPREDEMGLVAKALVS